MIDLFKPVFVGTKNDISKFILLNIFIVSDIDLSLFDSNLISIFSLLIS